MALKKIQDQVIVITGASSGIGLCTAKKAAEQGARVVICSRNEKALNQICDEITTKGGRVACTVADVAEPESLERVAQFAVKNFGRIDTWVNNAGITIYGRLTETPLVEKRRIFEVNFWGVVHGCRAALPHLMREGGALINIGSILSEHAIPLQGIYAASKHAVKAYTDALRMELEHDSPGVSVTLIEPTAINTPSAMHARNRLGGKAVHASPVYAPELVADSILRCAEHPAREVLVGGTAKVFSLMQKFTPRLTDKIMEHRMFQAQVDPGQPAPQDDALFAPPASEGQVHGDHEGKIHRRSLYTSVVLHPQLLMMSIGALA
ncbi:MAG: SDR family oxidoreductase, partial [Bdellovibrionota bacterium]